jgi:hypothetical protein
MFKIQATPTELDLEFERALAELAKLDIGTDEYEAVLERVMKLHKMKMDAKSSGVSPDNVLLVVANILSIMLVTRFERENIITSKALSMVPRLK